MNINEKSILFSGIPGNIKKANYSRNISQNVVSINNIFKLKD